MKYLSAVIRLVAGAVVLTMTYIVYLDVAADITSHPDSRANLLGHDVALTYGQMPTVLIGTGLFGALLCVIGAAGFFSRRGTPADQ